MNKNLLLAVVLSSLVYIAWFTYIAPPPKLEKKEIEEVVKKQDLNSNRIEKETAIIQTGNTNLTKRRVTNQTVNLKVNKAEISINEKGAIKSFIYEGPISPVKLVLDEETGFLNSLDNLEYKLISKTENSVNLYSKVNSSINLYKTFTFSPQNELNELEIKIENKSNKTYEFPAFEFSLGPGLGTVESEEKENPKIWEACYTFQEKNKKHPTISKIKSDIENENWIWAGINNRYFLFAVINEGIFSKIKYLPKKIKDNEAPFIILETKPISLNPNSQKVLKIKFYAGPKDYDLLKKMGYGLDRSVDFGVFSPLAKIANSALKYFYKLTGNYGIAIIILSVVLQIFVFPLGLKSYKAMAIMKKLQPEMQAIQVKYKNDPQKMNAEIMALYRKYGANPLSGCWPMLLQIPIFFSLFTTLRNSWNLHGAKFIFWIKDLSAKDPYFVLPILMGALMFLQQSLTPQTTTDPAQAKIMKWMPVIFTFMFLTFPSGLVIYWIVNSLFSIAQNLYLKSKDTN